MSSDIIVGRAGTEIPTRGWALQRRHPWLTRQRPKAAGCSMASVSSSLPSGSSSQLPVPLWRPGRRCHQDREPCHRGPVPGADDPRALGQVDG